MTALVKKAELKDFDGREMTSDGKFHANLLADFVIKRHVDKNKRNKWVLVREAAIVMYRSGSPSNQEKIKQRISKLATELKARGFTLVVEPTSKAFKIYEGSELEKEYVRNKQGYWEARAKKGEEWSRYLSESLESEGSPDGSGGEVAA